MSNFENQVAVITGASRGIGYAVAKRFIELGVKVVINVSSESSKEEILVVLSEDKVPENKFEVIVANVANFDEAKSLVTATVEKFGRIDILVNNAGITKDNLLLRMSEEDFDAVIDVNLKGAWNMMKHIVPVMIKQRYGRIINMSSVVGMMGNAGQVNYAASKSGMIGMTKTLAREYASRNITVNAIAPGFIQTKMSDGITDAMKKTMTEQIPMKKFGEVADVVFAVEMLADERAKYITGDVIKVDGGIYT